jgi:hypothetical protein
MSAKRCLWAVALLASVLAMTGCVGDSTEVEAAKAEYIRAKAHLIETEAQKTEQEIATIQQQRELAYANAELVAELSRQRQQALIEIGQVVISGGLSAGALLALLHALRLLLPIWTEQRVRQLQEEAKVLSQRIRWAEIEKSRLKHERVLQEAQAQVESECQETLQLQIQLTQVQTQLARERRWLEHTRRAQEMPIEYETAGGNGHGR